MKSIRTLWIALPLIVTLPIQTAFSQELDTPSESETTREELIEELKARIEKLEAQVKQLTGEAPEEPKAATSAEQGTSTEVSKQDSMLRDSVGDLNTPVMAGDFPRSIKLPGTGDVSIAFGGFIKTVGYFDTNLESESPIFLPALLGVGRLDQSGQMRQTAELSRFAFEARAPVANGSVRAYLEHEFRDGFNLRHAYLQWRNPWGELAVGQYWSAFMDLRSLIEGISEPTISGPIFARQAQFRFTRDINDHIFWVISFEDPSSNDLIGIDPIFARTKTPDIVSTLVATKPDSGHIQVGGILRQLQAESDLGKDTALGWGVHLSGHLDLLEKDRLIAGGVYGEGLGRYLLGITPFAAGIVDQEGKIYPRNNYGAYVAYQRFWNNRFRSSFALGYAGAENFAGQPGDSFSSSHFVLGNLMYRFNSYLTGGIEYNYGQRQNLDDSDIDNHRVMIGLQLF